VNRPAASSVAAILSVAALLPAASPTASPAGPDLTQESMRQAAESFYSIGLATSRVYPISKARLERAGMVVELEGGSLVLAQPILDRVTGACYSGKARLSLVPPTPAERASLKARSGGEAFTAEVGALYLRFGDATADELTSGLQPAADAAAAERCAKLFSSRSEVVRQYQPGTAGVPVSLELDLLEGLLSPALERGFFLLEADVPEKGWLTFLRRPVHTLDAMLLRLKPVGSMFETELWTGYTPPAPAGREAATRPASDIVHNQMELVIPNRSTYSFDSLLTWKGQVELGSARLSLVNTVLSPTWDDPSAKPVKIESVSLEDGTPLAYVHRRHELLVRLPAVLPAGQASKLRVKGTGQGIRQITPETNDLLNTYAWFPQEVSYLGGDYTFDWTVKVMRPLVAAGSGTTVREWEEKDRKLNCAQWRSDTPQAFPSLIFGQMKETKGEYVRKADQKTVPIRLHWIPQITVTDTSTGGGEPGSDEVERAGPTSERLSVPPGKPGQLVKEAAGILDFYEQVLGPYPNDELDIAQMGPGMWFGQAPPGLVQITAEYFMSSAIVNTFVEHPSVLDFLRTVLAHEIAHHYWGHVVHWKSEADVWLSESLAEYSAALYLQAAEGDKAFRQKRDSWRKEAERWEGTLPILHAHRVSGETAGEVYQALLYNKGPLVIHMLRSQAGNDNFVKILKKVLNDHRGGWIGTDDFQTAAEAVLGYDMDWFFDQWLRGTGIPEVRFSYTVTPQADKFLLKARAVQADRGHPKALFLPVGFQFGGGRAGKKEWRIKSADETLQVMLPEKPERVVVDEFNDLLVKIVYQ
jgi:hypothetical protein